MRIEQREVFETLYDAQCFWLISRISGPSQVFIIFRRLKQYFRKLTPPRF